MKRLKRATYFSNIDLTDRTSDSIRIGDLVWLDVFEPLLKHSGVTKMLGRVIYISSQIIYGHNYIISITDQKYVSINTRFRSRKDILLAVNKEKEFRDQIAEMLPHIVLAKFEKDF